MKLAFNNILWPTDFSPLSLTAADPVRSLAAGDFVGGLCNLFKAEVYVIHVQPPASLASTLHPPIPAAAELGLSSEIALDPARTRLDRLVEELFENDAKVQSEVLTGVPWHQVCGFAEQHRIELIVVATHGRTGLKHVLMGSVAERILQHAPCHVLIVKSHEDQLANAKRIEKQPTP
jgi:nucleotide-binding universal stress UspA family protein